MKAISQALETKWYKRAGKSLKGLSESCVFAIIGTVLSWNQFKKQNTSTQNEPQSTPI